MKSFFSGLVWKFLEKIAGQLISFVISIVLARLLMPEEYGMIAIVSAFITIADVFVANGFGTALIHKKDSDDLDFSSNFYVNFCLSIFLYAVLFAFAPAVAAFYNNPQLTAILRVLGLRLLFTSYDSIQQAYISRHLIFKNSAIATIIATVCSGATGLVMAFYGYGVWALVGQQLCMTVVQVVVLSVITKWHPKLQFSWKRTKAMLGYGNNVLLAALLDTATTQLRALLIGRYYSDADLAYYNRGDAYPQLLLNSINNTLHVVLFAIYAKEQDNRQTVKHIVRTAVSRGTFFIFPMMIGLAMVAKPLICLMLTEKWLGSVPYLQIACFAYATWVIQIVNQEAIIALGYSKQYVVISIVRSLIGLVLLFIAVRINVLAISISVVLSNIISTLIVCGFNRATLGYRFRELFLDIAPAILVAACIAGGVWLTSLIALPLLAALALQVAVGVVVFILVALITKNESFFWAFNKVKSVISR